jgi:membrane AbrB-like protein
MSRAAASLADHIATIFHRIPFVRWATLAVLSVLFAGVLTALDIPAALLLGPMIAGIVIACMGANLSIATTPFAMAQGVVGCMIAGTIQTSVAGLDLGDWPVFLFGVLAVIAASWLVGYSATRLHLFQGTTAVWGISPGAASVMTIMAEANGADAQMVAFMQYTRVLVVAALASILAACCGGAHSAVGSIGPWIIPDNYRNFAFTLILVLVGPLAVKLTRFPAAALIFSLVTGLVAGWTGFARIEIPNLILAVGYATVGWRIGLRFTRPLLLHVTKALPKIALCTLSLIAICALVGLALSYVTGLDYLSAYLATSPGGADSVAIIASSAHVDRAFVMTMQMTRLLCVVLLEPVIARYAAARSTTNV